MVDTVKSASITTLDGTTQQPPAPTQLTEGIGAVGYLFSHSDYVFATASGIQSTSSTYKLVRLPVAAILKDARLFTNAALDSGASLAVNLGFYWSDSTIDGTPYALQGTLINASSLVSAQAFGQSGSSTWNIFGLSNWNPNLLNTPLYVALGIQNTNTNGNPGGYVDIVLTPSTGAATGVAGNIGLEVAVVN